MLFIDYGSSSCLRRLTGTPRQSRKVGARFIAPFFSLLTFSLPAPRDEGVTICDFFIMNYSRNRLNQNEQKLRQIFSDSLQISLEQVVDSLEYNTIPEWDSVAHLSLVAAIDNGF